MLRGQGTQPGCRRNASDQGWGSGVRRPWLTLGGREGWSRRPGGGRHPHQAGEWGVAGALERPGKQGPEPASPCSYMPLLGGGGGHQQARGQGGGTEHGPQGTPPVPAPAPREAKGPSRSLAAATAPHTDLLSRPPAQPQAGEAKPSGRCLLRGAHPKDCGPPTTPGLSHPGWGPRLPGRGPGRGQMEGGGEQETEKGGGREDRWGERKARGEGQEEGAEDGGAGGRPRPHPAPFLGPRPAPELMLKWVKGASASQA